MKLIIAMFSIVFGGFLFIFLDIPYYWWKSRNEPESKKRCMCLACETERDKFFVNRFKSKAK